MQVSLIVTVKNEARSLSHLLDSICAQTHLPDEIIIVDGGSTDGTWQILGEYAARLPLKRIAQPGANISQGRNRAIREAYGNIICVTDAGTWLDPNWMAELLQPFANPAVSAVDDPQSAADVVAGFFVPDAHNAFEIALAATTLPVLADIRPAKFMPSSRSVAFRKSAWAHVGGYPEWLDFCEDLVFDFALRDAGFRFVFAPRAVAHFRPRENLRAFFKQYYQYARGDGKANLFFKRHLIRYATYLIGVPLIIAIVWSGFWLWGLGMLILGFLGMFATPYKRLFPMLRQLNFIDQVRAVLWVPIIRIAGDAAKMVGYPVGVRWRWQNRHRST